MGRPIKNLIGEKFGWLTVIDDDGYYVRKTGVKQKKWKCRCACGKEISVIGANLTAGNTSSCGCNNTNIGFDADTVFLSYEEYIYDDSYEYNIGIIDADFLAVKNHRFPNLVSMKLSGWYKEQGAHVALLLNYDDIEKFDKVFISKVFTDTEVPEEILTLPNVEYGGTGFYFDKAPALPEEIEHHMPDYHLYDWWIFQQLHGLKGAKLRAKRLEFKFYTDYSIGYTTRGCVRQCGFCVNKNYKEARLHSALSEFLDESRPKICLLDDNVLANKEWRNIWDELNATGKPWQYNQGLDLRLCTDETIKKLADSNTDGDIRFAFDNIEDREIIEKKIQLIRKYNKDKKLPYVFYILVGFDRDDKYDKQFWWKDIHDMFLRIDIVASNGMRPYICRYYKYKESPYNRMYTHTFNWVNYPVNFYGSTLREYCNNNPRKRALRQIEDNWFKRYIDKEYGKIKKEIMDAY